MCFEMTNVRLLKDLSKLFISSVRIMTREDIEIRHINLKLLFCCNLCNRSGSLVCPPANQHDLAVPLIFLPRRFISKGNS